MTVKELKTELSHYPDDMTIMLESEGGGFTYLSLESVTPKKINMSEYPGDTPLAKERCLILSNEI